MQERETRTQYSSSGTNSRTDNDKAFSEIIKRTRLGYTLGMGMEYAITKNLSFGAQYDYAYFGKRDKKFQNARAGATESYTETTFNPAWHPITNPGVPIFIQTHHQGNYDTVNGRNASNRIDSHALKIGLNYHF